MSLSKRFIKVFKNRFKRSFLVKIKVKKSVPFCFKKNLVGFYKQDSVIHSNNKLPLIYLIGIHLQEDK